MAAVMADAARFYVVLTIRGRTPCRWRDGHGLTVIGRTGLGVTLFSSRYRATLAISEHRKRYPLDNRRWLIRAADVEAEGGGG